MSNCLEFLPCGDLLWEMSFLSGFSSMMKRCSHLLHLLTHWLFHWDLVVETGSDHSLESLVKKRIRILAIFFLWIWSFLCVLLMASCVWICGLYSLSYVSSHPSRCLISCFILKPRSPCLLLASHPCDCPHLSSCVSPAQWSLQPHLCVSTLAVFRICWGWVDVPVVFELVPHWNKVDTLHSTSILGLDSADCFACRDIFPGVGVCTGIQTQNMFLCLCLHSSQTVFVWYLRKRWIHYHEYFLNEGFRRSLEVRETVSHLNVHLIVKLPPVAFLNVQVWEQVHSLQPTLHFTAWFLQGRVLAAF